MTNKLSDRSSIRERLNELETGNSVSRTSTIYPKFSSNYSEFVKRVAHEIRHHVIYRRDGGQFARALVRHSGSQLRGLSREFSNKMAGEGDVVPLFFVLFRRKSDRRERRLALKVKFYSLQLTTESDFSVGDSIVANDSEVKANADKFLTRCLGIAEDITKAIPRKRIVGFLELAERLGSRRHLDLWYYKARTIERWSVDVVSQPRFRAQAAKMTASTGGKMPFRGCSKPSVWEHCWRIYPFRSSGLNPKSNSSDSEIESKLLIIDEGIEASLDALISGSLISGSRQDGPDIVKFRKHVARLMEDKNHLYHVHDKLSPERRGLLKLL